LICIRMMVLNLFLNKYFLTEAISINVSMLLT